MTTFLQRILKGSKQNSPENTSASTGQTESTQIQVPSESADPIFGLAQSVGRVRDHNEDAVFTFGSHIAYQDLQAFAGLFIVADGMGGHADGELASGLAVRTISKHVLEILVNDINSGQSSLNQETTKKLLLEAVQMANQAIRQQVPGGGTTLTAALIVGQLLMFAHVGDSRAYRIDQDGSILALTRDHSFVRQLVEYGKLTEQEAAVHPQRNILSMALGQLEPLEPDFISIPLPTSGYILLCSDGLWGVLSEEKLSETVQSTQNPRIACDRLVQAANQAGGPDNITAVLISFQD